MEERYSGSQIAAAIGMEPANFRQHISRKGWRVIGKPDRKFGFEDALGYALARVLMQHGFDAPTAFERAMLDFAHSSDDPRRDPGAVFDQRELGKTFYVLSHGAVHGRILAEDEVSDPIELMTPPMHLPAGAVIVIDLSALYARIAGALGVGNRKPDERTVASETDGQPPKGAKGGAA